MEASCEQAPTFAAGLAYMTLPRCLTQQEPSASSAISMGTPSHRSFCSGIARGQYRNDAYCGCGPAKGKARRHLMGESRLVRPPTPGSGAEKNGAPSPRAIRPGASIRACWWCRGGFVDSGRERRSMPPRSAHRPTSSTRSATASQGSGSERRRGCRFRSPAKR